jgi:predicted dehydrogenase
MQKKGASGKKMKKVKWGILGAASIAVRRVIPGMQKGAYSEIAAIASRDKKKAEEAARKLGIPKGYGSYEELLQDLEIDAIYNPLPNHLHVPWSIKAAEAGKHVLCEKPISMTVAEARTLLAARERTGVKIGEAFMVKTHPQWLRTQEIIRSGGIGELRAIAGVFSYFNRDPNNVRHKVEWGGAGASRGRAAARPGFQDRSARFRDSRVSFGAIDLYLRHANCLLSANAFSWHVRARRNRNSVECAE